MKPWEEHEVTGPVSDEQAAVLKSRLENCTGYEVRVWRNPDSLPAHMTRYTTSRSELVTGYDQIGSLIYAREDFVDMMGRSRRVSWHNMWPELPAIFLPMAWPEPIRESSHELREALEFAIGLYMGGYYPPLSNLRTMHVLLRPLECHACARGSMADSGFIEYGPVSTIAQLMQQRRERTPDTRRLQLHRDRGPALVWQDGYSDWRLWGGEGSTPFRHGCTG